MYFHVVSKEQGQQGTQQRLASGEARLSVARSLASASVPVFAILLAALVQPQRAQAQDVFATSTQTLSSANAAINRCCNNPRNHDAQWDFSCTDTAAPCLRTRTAEFSTGATQAFQSLLREIPQRARAHLTAQCGDQSNNQNTNRAMLVCMRDNLGSIPPSLTNGVTPPYSAARARQAANRALARLNQAQVLSLACNRAQGYVTVSDPVIPPEQGQTPANLAAARRRVTISFSNRDPQCNVNLRPDGRQVYRPRVESAATANAGRGGGTSGDADLLHALFEARHGSDGLATRVDCPEWIPRTYCATGTRFDPLRYRERRPQGSRSALDAATEVNTEHFYRYTPTTQIDVGTTDLATHMDGVYNVLQGSFEEEVRDHMAEVLIEHYVQTAALGTALQISYDRRIRELRTTVATSCVRNKASLINSLVYAVPTPQDRFASAAAYQTQFGYATQCMQAVTNRWQHLQQEFGVTPDTIRSIVTAQDISALPPGVSQVASALVNLPVLRHALLEMPLPMRLGAAVQQNCGPGQIERNPNIEVNGRTVQRAGYCRRVYEEFVVLTNEMNALYSTYPQLLERPQGSATTPARNTAVQTPNAAAQTRSPATDYDLDFNRRDLSTLVAEGGGGFNTCMQRMNAEHLASASGSQTPQQAEAEIRASESVEESLDFATRANLESIRNAIGSLCRETSAAVHSAIRDPHFMARFFSCENTRMENLRQFTQASVSGWPRSVDGDRACNERKDMAWLACRHYRATEHNDRAWAAGGQFAMAAFDVGAMGAFGTGMIGFNGGAVGLSARGMVGGGAIGGAMGAVLTPGQQASVDRAQLDLVRAALSGNAAAATEAQEQVRHHSTTSERARAAAAGAVEGALGGSVLSGPGRGIPSVADDVPTPGGSRLLAGGSRNLPPERLPDLADPQHRSALVPPEPPSPGIPAPGTYAIETTVYPLTSGDRVSGSAPTIPVAPGEATTLIPGQSPAPPRLPPMIPPPPSRGGPPPLPLPPPLPRRGPPSLPDARDTVPGSAISQTPTQPDIAGAVGDATPRVEPLLPPPHTTGGSPTTPPRSSVHGRPSEVAQPATAPVEDIRTVRPNRRPLRDIEPSIIPEGHRSSSPEAGPSMAQRAATPDAPDSTRSLPYDTIRPARSAQDIEAGVVSEGRETAPVDMAAALRRTQEALPEPPLVPIIRPQNQGFNFDLDLPGGRQNIRFPEGVEYRGRTANISSGEHINNTLNGRTFTHNRQQVTFRRGRLIDTGGFSSVYEVHRTPSDGRRYVVKVDHDPQNLSNSESNFRRRQHADERLRTRALAGALESSANQSLVSAGHSGNIRVEFLHNEIPELEIDGMTIMREAHDLDISRATQQHPEYRPGVDAFNQWVRNANSVLADAIDNRTSELSSWNTTHNISNPERILPENRGLIVENANGRGHTLRTPLDLFDPRTGAPGRNNVGYRIETYLDSTGVSRQRLVIEVYDF